MQYSVQTKNQVNPLEAGRGLVHADTLVATTDDTLSIRPPAVLTVGGKSTTKDISDLGLLPGLYDAHLGPRKIKLILVSPDKVVRRFGVRHGSLEYDLPVVTGRGPGAFGAAGGSPTAPWASLWKTGEFADVVVDFDAPYKFVFWRGMSYAPSWALGNVMTSLFFAETVEPGVFRDCCEMMSDRECRYSHVRVVHASPARIVVHWRYALADSAYTICRDQWADELFYIYPDGVAVRNVTVHLDPHDESVWHVCPATGRKIPCNMIDHCPPAKRTFNDMEFITVNPPGATSDEVTPFDALTLMDTDRFSLTCRWPTPPSLAGEALPKLTDYLFRLNYKNRPGVFVATAGENLQVSLQPNTGSRYEAGALVRDDRWVPVEKLPSNFSDQIHWPITRGHGTTALTDPALYLDRPTHTFLGCAHTAPAEVRETGEATWTWFCGMAPEEDSALRARVKAWTNPAQIAGAEYRSCEGAYVVTNPLARTTLTVAPDRPVVTPTFLLRNLEKPTIKVRINNDLLDETQVSIGVERSLECAQTVITLKKEIPPSAAVQFSVG